MSRMKISPHVAPTGHGIPSEFFSELIALDIPVFCKAVDTARNIYDIQQLAYQTPNPHKHIGVFRKHDPYWEVPEYHLSPQEASNRNWQWHIARIPPELRKEWIWIETINEPDQTVAKADWIGWFMYHHGLKAVTEGRKFCGPGYAPGNPDEGAWDTPGMLAYLALCDEYPNSLAIALHEYSLHPTEIFTKKENGNIVPCSKEESGRLVGRFTDLVDTCQRNNLNVPKIFMTEWGYTLWEIPNNPQTAINQMVEVWDYYYKNYDIGAGIWYLGDGWQGIHEKVYNLVRRENGIPLKQAIIENEFEVDNMCNCTAIQDIKTTSIWIPQYNQMTTAEKTQVYQWAQTGFPLPNGTNTNGNHMLCPSHIDALRIHTAGLSGSILAVAYPHKIGTGVTLQWIQQNCPCALENGRQVVFLGQQSGGFTFDSPPIVTR